MGESGNPTPQGKEQPSGGAAPKQQGATEQKPEPKPAGKTYSQDEVDKLLGDQKKEYEGKMSEAEKLAKMSAKEKSEYESQQREKSIAERERAVAIRELKQTAADALREKGLDAELASILDYTDADSVSKSIKTVEKVFAATVERAVKDKLKASGGTPKTGGAPQAVSGIEAAFYKLNPRLRK